MTLKASDWESLQKKIAVLRKKKNPVICSLSQDDGISWNASFSWQLGTPSIAFDLKKIVPPWYKDTSKCVFPPFSRYGNTMGFSCSLCILLILPFITWRLSESWKQMGIKLGLQIKLLIRLDIRKMFLIAKAAQQWSMV